MLIELSLSKEHVELAILMLEQAKKRREKRIAILNDIVDVRTSTTKVGMITVSSEPDHELNEQFKEEIAQKKETIAKIDSLLNEFLKTGVR